MTAPKIRAIELIEPMIYAYDTPGIEYHNGWIKIGYTEKQKVEDRIRQQTQTADIDYRLLWKAFAKYTDNSGKTFRDDDFHRFLEHEKNIERKGDAEGRKKEWFKITKSDSRDYFDEFAAHSSRFLIAQQSYTLRDEQARAVSQTKEWFQNAEADGDEGQFLWNAKPRFGKTLATYDLIVRMGFKNVLIATNRPSIANSWADDFNRFIGWKHPLCFVSGTDALKGKPGVLTREEYINSSENRKKGMIAFVSLQDLKGSRYLGGKHNKLGWIAKESIDKKGNKQKGLQFDLLVIDESQEGAETDRTKWALENIDFKHTLYLSGTPFKQLASDQFTNDEIFNWSYADEQEAKTTWSEEGLNPYESLPQLLMFTYQLGPMIYDELKRGIILDDKDEAVDPAFDLNEFFITNKEKDKNKDNDKNKDKEGKFCHQEDIKKFLLKLFTCEKYPFSTPELRNELKHTLWLFNRVDSVNALKKLMREDEELKPLFAEYEIIIAAGKNEDDSRKAYDRVKEAIAKHDKTITLSVGQLTVGVTIPEWSGVFMLCNLQSPSAYMQAAFRAQNPYSYADANGQLYRKERAYLFDFDPARTLIIYDQFANNLRPETAQESGTSEDRKENIRRLLNFFPVLGEDDEGRMVELNAEQVLTIPRKLKSVEVVRRGFMSNFLFANISGIFGASSIVGEILQKLPTAAEEKTRQQNSGHLDGLDSVQVDNDGQAIANEEIVIGQVRGIFGDKIYEKIPKAIETAIDEVATAEPDNINKNINKLTTAFKKEIEQNIVAPISNKYDLTQKAQNKILEQARKEIETKISRAKKNFDQKQRLADTAFKAKRNSAETAAELGEAEVEYTKTVRQAQNELNDSINEIINQKRREIPKEIINKLEQAKEEDKKKKAEDEIRAHLRGFARTIPSFIMAYGDENLTLANFDDYTEETVFLEVTGITQDEFRFLRDGGDKLNPATGNVEHFNGHLFDEVVFNDSIQEFLRKRTALANYFDENNQEDIFDYIPPQKNNQIFTPKHVVKLMVDKLEEENPGCFDDPTKTFADLYMKSGLFITEIVRRLYRSQGLKSAFPNEKDRIRHILQNQVYGMAPTRIIYLIATNYILGFDETLKSEQHHFVEADAAEAAKTGRLTELVEENFG